MVFTTSAMNHLGCAPKVREQQSVASRRGCFSVQGFGAHMLSSSSNLQKKPERSLWCREKITTQAGLRV